jgi:hypothetical protein
MKIAIFTNINSPATDFYRTVGCYAYMGHDIRYLAIESAKWFDLMDVDVVVAKSPNGMAYFEMLRECKRMGKKIIIDHDDNLHETTRTNPAHVGLSHEAMRKTVEDCFGFADHIIYSTDALQKYYMPYHEGIASTVINNGWNPIIQPFMPVPKIEDKIRFIWRGSMHHLDDIGSIASYINELAEDESCDVAMLGIQDFIMAHLFPKVKTKEWNSSLFGYFETLNNSQCHYGLFPLLKNDFNFAKSNIFAIEMLVAGGVTIAPKGIAEYNIPGVIKYDNFGDVMEAVKNKDFDREAIVKEGREYLNDVLRVDKTNKKRELILNNLN